MHQNYTSRGTALVSFVASTKFILCRAPINDSYHVRSITRNQKPGHGTIKVICLSEFGNCTVLAGAFSLIRYSAFQACLDKLSKIPNPNKLREVNRLELGEDRYMTTILISKGYKTEYVHQAVAKTSLFKQFYFFEKPRF